MSKLSGLEVSHCLPVDSFLQNKHSSESSGEVGRSPGPVSPPSAPSRGHLGGGHSEPPDSGRVSQVVDQALQTSTDLSKITQWVRGRAGYSLGPKPKACALPAYTVTQVTCKWPKEPRLLSLVFFVSFSQCDWEHKSRRHHIHFSSKGCFAMGSVVLSLE